MCVCVSHASSLKRRCRPYKGTLTSPEGGGAFVRTGRHSAALVRVDNSIPQIPQSPHPNPEVMRALSALCVASLCALAAAFDAERCAEYAAAGHCSQQKTAKYMSRHCSSFCSNAASNSEEDSNSGEDDPSCSKWKAEGYCEHEQYAEYMQSRCASACGLARAAVEEEVAVSGYEAGLPPPAAAAADPPPCSHDRVRCAEFDETGTEFTGTATAEEMAEGEGDDDDDDSDKSESCAAWAKQGCVLPAACCAGHGLWR